MVLVPGRRDCRRRRFSAAKIKNLYFCQSNKCLDDMKAQGMVGFHLITACDGVLPSFYESFGFKKEERVMLMGL